MITEEFWFDQLEKGEFDLGMEDWAWFARWLRDERDDEAGANGIEIITRHGLAPAMDPATYCGTSHSHDWWWCDRFGTGLDSCYVSHELFLALPRTLPGYPRSSQGNNYREFRTRREAYEQLLYAARKINYGVKETVKA